MENKINNTRKFTEKKSIKYAFASHRQYIELFKVKNIKLAHY